MCACELHWQDGATCTCNCPSHAADRNAQREAKREWKPGDVAMVRKGRSDEHIAVRSDLAAVDWHCLHGECHNVTEARPLVVIDPEDFDAVARLARIVEKHAGADAERLPIVDLVPVLREFASPTPPKCGARLSIDYGDQGANHTCEEPEGHDGAHSDGAMSWMTGGPR